MAESLPVTVAIPVRNEEAALPACLARLGAFRCVDVIDSNSTDRTAEIARSAGARVIPFAWDGTFPKKRNWYLRNRRPETPWVLFLDADELLDEAFCEELRETLASTSHVGFWITYDNWFLGRRLKHGTPNRKLALFRVGAGEYERIAEERWTPLDMEIHEHPVLEGSVGEIRSRVDHRDDRGLAHWLRRHVEYAQWEAARARALAASGTEGAALTDRQRRKYATLGRWWLPAAYFLHGFVLKRGFLDGSAGFAHALLKSWYFLVIGLMLRRESFHGGRRT
jgi:glycosyltransferase involved in cell wall biosynthesis